MAHANLRTRHKGFGSVYDRIRPAERTSSIVGTQGFTLVELLTGLAVIGILMTIAGTKFREYTIRAKRVEVETNFRQASILLAAAIENSGRPWTTNWNDQQFRDFVGIPAHSRFSYGLIDGGGGGANVPMFTAAARAGDPATRDEFMALPGGPRCLCTDAVTEALVPFAACGNKIASLIGRRDVYGMVRTYTVSIFALRCGTGNID
jgi:prepilin-type N-terminal cleavage/methylation domain-containing protein